MVDGLVVGGGGEGVPLVTFVAVGVSIQHFMDALGQVMFSRTS